MFFLETEHESDESDAVKQERDNPVKSDERIQIMRLAEEHPEIIDGRFAVEVIITRKEEIPRQYSKPGKVVASIHGISDGDEFMVTLREREQKIG